MHIKTYALGRDGGIHMPSYMKHVYNNVILLQYLASGANVKRKTFFIMSLNTLHSAFALHKRSRHVNLYCLQPLFPVICCNISDLYRGSCCPPALVTRKAEFILLTAASSKFIKIPFFLPSTCLFVWIWVCFLTMDHICRLWMG